MPKRQRDDSTETKGDDQPDNDKLLREAAYDGELEKVQDLLKQGVGVNVPDEKGNTPLHWAVYKLSRLEIMRLLIENGADVNARNKDGNTALFNVCSNDAQSEEDGLLDYAQLLIDSGADTNMKGVAFDDDDQSTMLDQACGCMHKEIVRLLLRNGAKVSRMRADLDALDEEMMAVLREESGKKSEEESDEESEEESDEESEEESDVEPDD